jgi:hypothetical protein
MASSFATKGRRRPALFRALGDSDPPLRIEIGGARYRREQILKHDSWACTAIYTGPVGRIVCKFNRRQSIFGLPTAWLGRRLARREMRFYKLLSDLPCIAPPCGEVFVRGQEQANAAAHRYVEGHPLGEAENPGAAFFADLERCLTEIHRRGVAYMDFHKRENIVVGDDGKPYLVDFQTSYLARPDSWFWPVRAILSLFQAADRYHLLKHKLRNSDLDRHEARAIIDRHRPLWLRLHRFVAAPLRMLRRRLLVRLRIRTGSGRAQSEHFTEDGLREPTPPAQKLLRQTGATC